MCCVLRFVCVLCVLGLCVYYVLRFVCELCVKVRAGVFLFFVCVALGCLNFVYLCLVTHGFSDYAIPFLHLIMCF